MAMLAVIRVITNIAKKFCLNKSKFSMIPTPAGTKRKLIFSSMVSEALLTSDVFRALVKNKIKSI